MPSHEILPAALPPCLLSYRFSSLPSPAQVSTSTAASPAVIDVWVSTPAGQSLYCNKLQLAVPVGSTATDLTEHPPSLTPNTTWWTVSSSETVDGEVLGLTAGTVYTLFTAVCASSTHWLIDYDLAFSLTVAAVNQVEGEWGYVVGETSGTSASNLTLHRDVFTLTKGPATTYLVDVTTVKAPPSPGTLPCTRFAQGEPIKVTWETNAASSAIYVGGASTPVWKGTDTSHVLDGFAVDTTIVVQAVGGGGPDISEAVTVTISNPALTPTAATAGTATVTGATTLAAATAANLTTGAVTAAGVTTLQQGVTASALTAAGPTTLQGVQAGSVAVTGSLAATTSGLGPATATSLQVSNQVTMVSPRSLNPGGYVPSTDGLVVGTVGISTNAGQKCSAIAWGSTAALGNVYANGGNQVIWTDGKNFTSWVCGSSFVLPVQRGVGFSVGSYQVSNADQAAPVTFTWVPFGTQATLTTLADHELAALGLEVPAPPEPVALDLPEVAGDLTDLFGVVQELFGDRLTPDLAERLGTAVSALSARA